MIGRKTTGALFRRLTAIALAASTALCASSCFFEDDLLEYREDGSIIDPLMTDLSDTEKSDDLSPMSIVSPEFDTAESDNSDEFSRTEYTHGDQRIRFLAVGDNICHEAVAKDAAQIAGDDGYDFSGMYENISERIKLADVSIINQECMMPGYGEYSYYPTYNVPRELGDAVLGLGFDVVSLTNDHMIDCGTDGLFATEEYFEQNGAFVLGAYKNEADLDNIRVMDKDGIRIAFVYFTNKTEVKHSQTSEIYIPYIDTEDIKHQMKIARECSDVIIAVMHWGVENTFNVSDTQRNLAALLASEGACAIIGSGPHVLQPVEWIDGANGSRTLVAYSLGNFLSGMYYGFNAVGGMLSFDVVISADKTAASVTVENVICEPTVCHYNNKRLGFKLYLLSEYTKELCNAHGGQNFTDFGIADMFGYATGHVSSEFLPDFYRNTASSSE